jgi:hypothetical protein
MVLPAAIPFSEGQGWVAVQTWWTRANLWIVALFPCHSDVAPKKEIDVVARLPKLQLAVVNHLTAGESQQA